MSQKEILIFQRRQRVECIHGLNYSAHRLAHMGLHSSNSCRWKPPNNDHRGDQLKAVILFIGLGEEWERGGERRVRSGIRTMSNVTGGASSIQNSLSLK